MISYICILNYVKGMITWKTTVILLIQFLSKQILINTMTSFELEFHLICPFSDKIVNSQKDQFLERMKPSKFILNYTLLNWLKLMKLVKLWKPNCGSSSDGNVLFFDAELNIPVYPILSQLRYWVIFLAFHRYFEISDQKFQDQKSRKTGILFQINEC